MQDSRQTRDDRPKLPCLDCGADTASDALGEYYMVTNDVWKKGGAGQHILCIGCLEGRIQRRLTPADFTEAPVNYLLMLFPKSDRILDRMGCPWVEVSA